jgi:hypothetical protein
MDGERTVKKILEANEGRIQKEEELHYGGWMMLNRI